jgi:hypothetical protein
LNNWLPDLRRYDTTPATNIVWGFRPEKIYRCIKAELEDMSNIKPVSDQAMDDGVIQSIKNSKKGDMIFNKTLKKPQWWNGTVWVDEKGFTATVNKGTTRPTGIGGGGMLDATRDIGFEFFDTNPNVMKPIYVKAIANDGTVTWVDATGTEV